MRAALCLDILLVAGRARLSLNFISVSSNISVGEADELRHPLSESSGTGDARGSVSSALTLSCKVLNWAKAENRGAEGWDVLERTATLGLAALYGSNGSGVNYTSEADADEVDAIQRIQATMSSSDDADGNLSTLVGSNRSSVDGLPQNYHRRIAARLADSGNEESHHQHFPVIAISASNASSLREGHAYDQVEADHEDDDKNSNHTLAVRSAYSDEIPELTDIPASHEYGDELHGEMTPHSMMDILLTAAGIGARKPVTPAMLPEYEFYDVGTGSGKFPVFAALLGMTAVGSGLDQSRLQVGAAVVARLLAEAPCLHADAEAPCPPIRFETGDCEERQQESTPGSDTPIQERNSVDHSPAWSQGVKKRIVMIDRHDRCVEHSAGKIDSSDPRAPDPSPFEELLRQARWEPGSVLVSMATMSSAIARAGWEYQRSITVETSWSNSTPIDFFVRDPLFVPPSRSFRMGDDSDDDSD